jgi:hypothetical protein
MSNSSNKILLCIERAEKAGMQTARCWSVSTQAAVSSGSASFHSYNLKQSYNHARSFIFKTPAKVHVETQTAQGK